jgi:transposase
MYHLDLKNRIIDLYYKLKLSIRGLSKLVSVSKSTISRWINQKNTQLVKNKIGRKETLNDNERAIIIDFVSNNELITLNELQKWITLTHGKTVSRSTLTRLLKKGRISYKNVRKSLQKTIITEEQRKSFITDILTKGYKNIVCLDEVGFQLNMKRTKGWSKIGSRCISYDKKIRRVNYHGIFIINADKGIEYQIYDKPINIDSFSNFIKNLKNSHILSKTIVLDNLRIHHNLKVKTELLNKFSDIRWTPSYSPDLNPIETVFSSLKAYLKRITISTKSELIREINNYIKLNDITFSKYYKHSWS